MRGGGGITGDSYGSFKNPVLISDSSDELTPTGSFSSMDPNKMARDAIGDVGLRNRVGREYRRGQMEVQELCLM